MSYQDRRIRSNKSFPDSPFEFAVVQRVVDGDTLQVLHEDTGCLVRVRLIGIDAPECVAPEEHRNKPEGVVASDFAKRVLKEGSTVWLQRDVTDVDQYDRLLRFVWLRHPTTADSVSQVREKMLNAQLVEGGYARARRYPPNNSLDELFEALEKRAVSAGRGMSYLWADMR